MTMLRTCNLRYEPTSLASGPLALGYTMGLSGNVDEWVEDDFQPYPGSDAPAEVFQAKVGRANSAQDQSMKVVEMMPVKGRYKVLRGGSWKSDPFSTALYHRNFAFPNYASDFFGFRCAADVNGKEK